MTTISTLSEHGSHAEASHVRDLLCDANPEIRFWYQLRYDGGQWAVILVDPR